MLPNHVINTDTVVKNADTLNLQRGNAEVKKLLPSNDLCRRNITPCLITNLTRLELRKTLIDKHQRTARILEGLEKVNQHASHIITGYKASWQFQLPYYLL